MMGDSLPGSWASLGTVPVNTWLIGRIRDGNRPIDQIKQHHGDKSRHHRGEGREPAEHRRIDLETLRQPADYTSQHPIVPRSPEAGLQGMMLRRNGPLVKSIHSLSSRPTHLSWRAPHVLVDVFCKHVEWHVSSAHDGIVEGFQVEPRSKRCFRFLALPVDLAVADLVATRLSRP